MQLVNLATGALDKVDMTGMQRVELTEYDTNGFLLPGKFKPQKTVLALLPASHTVPAPPDVFSQTLLATPMYCLFEIGVFFSRFYVGKGRNREEENDAEAESEKTEE